MSACTFFGHGDCPDNIRPQLKDAILSLAESGVRDFYVGCNGNFDKLVRSVLREFSSENALRYAVVLAYLDERAAALHKEGYPTLFPEGLEDVPPRFAISWRNKWMIKKSDYVLCYVKYSFGGAAKFRESAIKQGKTVMDLAEQRPSTNG